MAMTEYSGVVINNLTLAKYKELKAAGQKVASQSYVITDLDEYLDKGSQDLLKSEFDKTLNVFDMNTLDKLTFSSTGNNASTGFAFTIFDSDSYNTRYNYLVIASGTLTGTETFTIPTNGIYFVKIGLNGNAVDNKQSLWMYLEAGTYTLSCVLSANVLNSCTVTSIMLTKGSVEVPYQAHKGKILHEKDVHFQCYNDEIDTTNSGFIKWNCENSSIRPNTAQQYYYVYSNITWVDDEFWGVQMAICENSTDMYFRNHGDNQVWSSWKKVRTV